MWLVSASASGFPGDEGTPRDGGRGGRADAGRGGAWRPPAAGGNAGPDDHCAEDLSQEEILDLIVEAMLAQGGPPQRKMIWRDETTGTPTVPGTRGTRRGPQDMEARLRPRLGIRLRQTPRCAAAGTRARRGSRPRSYQRAATGQRRRTDRDDQGLAAAHLLGNGPGTRRYRRVGPPTSGGGHGDCLGPACQSTSGRQRLAGGGEAGRLSSDCPAWRGEPSGSGRPS